MILQAVSFITVSKLGKTLKKMENNPRDWRIDDLEAVARKLKMTAHKGNGSHVVFRHAELAMALSVPAHRPVKPIYIQQFLAMVKQIMGENDE